MAGALKKAIAAAPRAPKSLLLNPFVDAAVLETARGGIIREGLGFDKCDVAVVTNIEGGDHLDQHDINTLDKLAVVKRTVVEAVAKTARPFSTRRILLWRKWQSIARGRSAFLP